MRTELRFVLALVLMIGVMIVTNIVFPATRPTSEAVSDSTASVASAPGATPSIGSAVAGGAAADASRMAGAAIAAPDDTLPTVDAAERQVVVESPLYRYSFSTHGARLVSARLPTFTSFTREGPVELVPDSTRGAFGLRLVVRNDTIDLGDAPFTPSRESVSVGGQPEDLVFRHTRGGLDVEVRYSFSPDDYLIEATGTVTGVDRPLLLATLGSGIALNDADASAENRALAYVANHLEEGITSHPMRETGAPLVHEGPFLWAAFKSKFFVFAMLPGAAGKGPDQFGGLLVDPLEPERYDVAVSEPIGGDGAFGWRAYVGPQDNARLKALGDELDEVNPYSWRWMRPVIRPIVSAITAVLVFLHETLQLSYGWVLVMFGPLVRLLLWPLNQKAMRAQQKNMEVQPRMKQLQEKYKGNPEKMQQEMLKLYKETGFNPFAGCLPLLMQWPILISLYFVFQNTIEFRGVPFLWLPDLSAPDPIYVLPVFMGVTMFVLQWIGLKFMPDPNPQMKMMMWMMPIMMVAIFFKFAAGLNLYYAVSNLATIPQQYWIGKERMKNTPRAATPATP